MIDNNSPNPYTSNENLDNEINEEAMPTVEGDLNMGRQRIHVTLPNGEKVWITGSTYSELIGNALAKYGGISYQPSESFKDYTDRIFDVFLKPRWKSSTADTNKFLLNKHILPYFEKIPLNQIDVLTVQRFFQTKQHLSKSYTKQMLIMLHEIFENAIEDKIIKEDPTLSKRITLPEKVTKRKALEQKQFYDIVSHIDDLSGEDRIFNGSALLYRDAQRRNFRA